MLKKLFIGILSVVCLLGCIGCSKTETEYKVEKSKFYFSIDNGHTYGDGRVDLEVGKTVFMKLFVKVNNNTGNKDVIDVRLTIPYIDEVDAYYVDGQPIKGNIDSINKAVYYDFKIFTNEEFVLVYKFVPNATQNIEMSLVFDDKVSELYDHIRTIHFINPTPQDSNEQ